MASKALESGRRLILAGEVGDLSSVGSGGLQCSPPSSDRQAPCSPWSGRAQEKRVPSASSTTPGSSIPSRLGTGNVHQLGASRQVAPSSSERYQHVIARQSTELEAFAVPIKRLKGTGMMIRPARV